MRRCASASNLTAGAPRPPPDRRTTAQADRNLGQTRQPTRHDLVCKCFQADGPPESRLAWAAPRPPPAGLTDRRRGNAQLQQCTFLVLEWNLGGKWRGAGPCVGAVTFSSDETDRAHLIYLAEVGWACYEIRRLVLDLSLKTRYVQLCPGCSKCSLSVCS